MYLDWNDPYSGARYDLFSTGSPKEFGDSRCRFFYVIRIADDSMSVVEYDWDHNKGTWRNKYIKKIKTLKDIYKALGFKGRHVTAQ